MDLWLSQIYDHLRFLTWLRKQQKKKKISTILRPSTLFVLYLFCILGSVYMGPGKRVTLPAKLTFSSVYMRKKPTHLSKPRALANTLIVSPLHPHISFFFNFSFQSKGNSRIRRGAFGRSLFEPRTTVMDEDLRLVTWRVLGCHMLAFNQETE